MLEEKKNHNKSINCRRFSDVSPFPKPILEGLISDNQQWIYSKTGILKVIEVLQDNLHFSSANPGYSWCFFCNCLWTITFWTWFTENPMYRGSHCHDYQRGVWNWRTIEGHQNLDGKNRSKLPALNQPTEKSWENSTHLDIVQSWGIVLDQNWQRFSVKKPSTVWQRMISEP